MTRFASRYGWLWCAVVCLLLLASCGPDGPRRYRVTGKVTWEGAPLPAGDILLTPTNGGIPDAGKIKDGAYDMLATEGAKQVAIIAVREVGPIDPSMGMARRENYIPPRYNDATTLTLNVSPDGTNSFDFALTEKEPPK